MQVFIQSVELLWSLFYDKHTEVYRFPLFVFHNRFHSMFSRSLFFYYLSFNYSFYCLETCHKEHFTQSSARWRHTLENLLKTLKIPFSHTLRLSQSFAAEPSHVRERNASKMSSKCWNEERNNNKNSEEDNCDSNNATTTLLSIQWNTMIQIVQAVRIQTVSTTKSLLMFILSTGNFKTLYLTAIADRRFQANRKFRINSLTAKSPRIYLKFSVPCMCTSCCIHTHV